MISTAVRSILAAGLVAVAAGVFAADKIDPGKKDTRPDAAFVTQAGQAGLAEVQLGKIAQQNGSSAAVKEFLQAVGAEVAGILEGAISESLAQIAHLKTRSIELEGKIAGLKREALQADYDELTKALTRRGFLTRAERFLSLAREYETPCAVGFVDVDNFKALNDKLGLAGGDVRGVALPRLE